MDRGMEESILLYLTLALVLGGAIVKRTQRD